MEVINGTGRRKTSVARVYFMPGSGNVVVNGKTVEAYFTTPMLQQNINKPLEIAEITGYDVKINTSGGGITGQAEAAGLGLARAIVKIDPDKRSILKENGFLKRDPRMVERKKPGQKKARKSFQFSKR